MAIDTEYFDRSLATVAAAVEALNGVEPGTIQYDLYRAACIKTFEITLVLNSGR